MSLYQPRNPFAVALGVIAGALLAIAAIIFFVVESEASGYEADVASTTAGLVWAGALLNWAIVSAVGMMVLLGVGWYKR